MQPDELKDLVQILNPRRIEGRLVLITRYGAGKVKAHLPLHIKAVAESGVCPSEIRIEGFPIPALCR